MWRQDKDTEEKNKAVHFHGFIMLILWNVKQYCGIKTTYTMYSHNTPYSYKERDLTKTLFFFFFTYCILDMEKETQNKP